MRFPRELTIIKRNKITAKQFFIWSSEKLSEYGYTDIMYILHNFQGQTYTMTRVSRRQLATLSVHSTPAEIVPNIDILYHFSYRVDSFKNKSRARFLNNMCIHIHCCFYPLNSTLACAFRPICFLNIPRAIVVILEIKRIIY